MASASFTPPVSADALKAWRKTMIGRGNPLKARDFDNAVHGAEKAMGGHPETVASLLVRSRWYVSQGIPPVFARPVDWDWKDEELEVIRIARVNLEPVFLAYDENGIDKITGPATKPNPWDRWR
jgi:hypothetical protein